jgi:hypothetical protein
VEQNKRLIVIEKTATLIAASSAVIARSSRTDYPGCQTSHSYRECLMERSQQDVLPAVQADVETLRQELERLSTCVAKGPTDDSNKTLETERVVKGK